MSARKMSLDVNELAANNNSMSLIEFQTYTVEGDERLQKDIINHAHAWWDDPLTHTKEINVTVN